MLSVTDTAQVHLPPVDAICPDGHRTSVQAPSGKRVRCGPCRKAGRTVMVTVPPRPGVMPAPEPRAPSAPPAKCRTCGTTAPPPPGGRVPHGWMTVWISADPARDPRRRARVALGPWCSARCAAAALAARAVAGGKARGRPDDDRVSYRDLMTERPVGR